MVKVAVSKLLASKNIRMFVEQLPVINYSEINCVIPKETVSRT